MGKPQIKAKTRLQRRIKHYEGMVSKDRYGGKGYTRPGSQKK
jgi:hypothetical protein